MAKFDGLLLIGSRTMLWQRIAKEQLRELPDKETCRQVFANGTQTRKVAGDLTISIVHPKAGRSMKYSVRGLDGIMVGMVVEIQPLLVTQKPLCIVTYESGGIGRSFEIEPITFNEAGFDITAPVFGESYKRPKDTVREKRRKELETPEALQAVMGAAHSFIQPKNPFLSQKEGEAISLAETVKVSEILISATEAAKRYKAETGIIPEGFISRLKNQYPDGVPTTAVNALVAEWKEENKPERDYKSEAVVINGNAAGLENFIAADAQRKMA